MDPLLWDAIQSLRCARNQQSVDKNSMYNASMTDGNQNSYCEFSVYTVGEPQRSAGGSEEWKGSSSTLYDLYNQQSEAKDPDGEPLPMEDEDPELARKRKELREIEQRIKQKKVSIALRAVDHVVKTAPEAPSTNGQSLHEYEGPTLRERVHAILQRHPDSFLSKVHTHPRGSVKSSSLSKLQGDHPLKLRVKTLLKQRHDDPFVFSAHRQVPDITPPPPARRETSAENEACSIDLGFQRFLSILNKGVDMDMLSKIVNADGEDLPVEAPDVQPLASEEKLELPLRTKRQGQDPPLRSESQGSSRGASLPRHSRTSSTERKTNPRSPERSGSERVSLPSDEEKRKDREGCCLLPSGASLPSHSPTSSAERKTNPRSQERSHSQKLSLHEEEEDEVKNNQADRCFASSSRSKSPPALKKQKKEKKEKQENTPKVDDHRVQLQNILKTLGLSLEVEEMSKLTDRTQERLYGKKKAESREEQESQQRGPHNRDTNSSSSPSSSSSSSSSSSGSESRSSSPSPSRRQLSCSRVSKEKRTSGRSRSRDRRRDELSNHDSKRDSRKALRHRNREREQRAKDTFTHKNPDSHQPFPSYSAQHPAGFPAYTEFSQYSQYESYYNTYFNSATDSYWMDPRNAHSASFYPREYSHLQSPFYHYSDPSAAWRKVCELSAQDMGFFELNPDLSSSEGQVGPASGSRYLREVSTQQAASQRRLRTHEADQRMIKMKNRTKDRSKTKQDVAPKTHRNVKKRELIEVKAATERMEVVKNEEEALHDAEDHCETEEPEEEKQAPTEEEIKTNLRKMLAAFNKKPKPNVIQPPNFISCETE